MYNLCLNIDDIGVQDSGRYTVVISNIAGKDSFTVKLTIDDGIYHCLKSFKDVYN